MLQPNLCFAECVFCDAKNPLDLLCSAAQIVAGRLRGPVWRMRRISVQGDPDAEEFRRHAKIWQGAYGLDDEGGGPHVERGPGECCRNWGLLQEDLRRRLW